MLFPKDIFRQKSLVPLAILLAIALLAQVFLLLQSLFLAVCALPFLCFFVFWEMRQVPPIAFRFLKDGRFFYADTIGGEWIEAKLTTLYFWHPLLIALEIQNGKKRVFCLYRCQFQANDFRYLRLFFKFLAHHPKIDNFPR